MAKRPWTAVVLGLASFALGLAHAQPPEPPNAIDYSMFFLADVRDSPECVVTVGEDGGVDYGSTITNPAVSCPDAFAWSTFIDVGENAPYVVMDFATEQGGSKGPFLLLSFHISTKDLPSWFWATFEHVDNQGRCDWTGCNDSFGFLADGGRRLALLPAQGQPDRLRHADRPRDASRQLGGRGRIHQLGLLHQRHARAAVDASGLPPLAIFTDELSDAGLPKSVNGIPDEAWFDVNAYFGVEGRGQAPGILAIQTDFVWGFRNACPMSKRPLGPSRCANVTDSQ